MRGSYLVGLFLGWQAIVTLIALILVVAIVRLRNKIACIRLAVDALFWLALLQILFWGKLSNMLLK